MSGKFEGIVIGGPHAGRFLSGERSIWRVVHVPKLGDVDTGGSIEHTHYVFRDYNGTKLWVPNEWGPDEVIRELTTHYRPSV